MSPGFLLTPNHFRSCLHDHFFKLKSYEGIWPFFTLYYSQQNFRWKHLSEIKVCLFWHKKSFKFKTQWAISDTNAATIWLAVLHYGYNNIELLGSFFSECLVRKTPLAYSWLMRFAMLTALKFHEVVATNLLFYMIFC